MQNNPRDRTPRSLNLICEPHPKLHLKSEAVPVVDDEIRDLMDDMLFTMYHSNGVGLAAVQVGILKNVIVIDVGDRTDKKAQPLFLVNAEIIESSKTTETFKEGCLSLPGIYSEVLRPSDIRVKYLDYFGVMHDITVHHSLLSVCIQHEIDHTNGIIFTDRISRIKRDLLLKKMLKMRKEH